jgi:hypothetical protein
MSTFNLKTYIANLAENVLQNIPGYDFQLTEVSGVNGLEGIISGQTAYDNFIATDATGDGYLVQNANGGYFINRVCTVFIVRKYQYMNMADMLDKMEVCRRYFKIILRNMVKDREQLKLNLIYLNTERVAIREFEPEISAHFTGLFFQIGYEQPYNLLSNAD